MIAQTLIRRNDKSRSGVCLDDKDCYNAYILYLFPIASYIGNQ